MWESDAVGARLVRAALTPAELLFGAVTSIRSSLYSSGILASHATPIPAISIGNLTVGGTGKTPVAAYVARRLRDAGASPAIVLRGYGDDEPVVHRTLNPDVPVVVSPDRLAGIASAQRQGCDVAVLDDAFQHRRVRRVADVVIVSADGWQARSHLLPAGPWRERLSAARRATLAIVTRKAASGVEAQSVADAVAKAGRISTAIVHLDADDLRQLRSGARDSITNLRGQSVLVIAGIGNPAAFAAQVAARGARVDTATFGDHHAYSAIDASTLAERANRYDRVVCTLKDCVKLAPLWPGSTPLWYVSQRVSVERGGDELEAVLAATLNARTSSTHSARSG
jgi:tetraacyldisaccharide 4'-kinase